MHDALLHALASVDRPGDFYTAGDLPLTMPGLVVEGLGALRLPLGKAQARKLIGYCRHAPYGKGTQTLVDTAVRRVWELDAQHLEFTNPKWASLIESIVDEMRHKLGLEAHKLAVHLYKLLVYEKDSFSCRTAMVKNSIAWWLPWSLFCPRSMRAATRSHENWPLRSIIVIRRPD
jgi:hypothetical protein